jgi:hypothetical protein
VLAPVVGTSAGVFAATGKPVLVVTPDGPMNAAAELLTSKPPFSGTSLGVATNVAVVATDT